MMKKTVVNVLTLALAGTLLFACSNKEMESRIAKLEGKVAELEAGKRPTVNPAAPATPVAEEVKPEGPLPAFDFPEEVFDFGTIKEGEVVEHTFKFKNVGDAPLIIADAQASCGCTVPVYTKDPIAIGKEGEIKVRFDSKGKPGIQNKTVTITANTYPKTSRLRIKANVTKAENPS